MTGSSDPLLIRRRRGRVDTHIVSTWFFGLLRPQPGFSPPNTEKHFCKKKQAGRAAGGMVVTAVHGRWRSLPHADEVPTARSRYLGHMVASRQIDKKVPFQDELK